ncbi:DUF2147 domain-containing protein [Daejeonella sp.]|uniref:DUF2147 domain-containing protein n=1 Tax=Daejeonella sp. TaxID=2805397 RepID=UPI0027321130|nr:DUF2147 domain-containing protein [Daejeonella sp.]MDP2414266.1 DUF2147 domain-containing protein [Daejeonella sp.]
MNIKYLFLDLLISFYAGSIGSANSISDQIIGKWMSTAENITVLVFKEGDQYNAKVLWFNDSDDRTRPMITRTDQQNPDPALRNRKIIGLEILRNLKFNASINRWEKGIIYDVRTGREWNLSALLTKNGMLEVKGFWHFEFMGQTMTFKRVK